MKGVIIIMALLFSSFIWGCSDSLNNPSTSQQVTAESADNLKTASDGYAYSGYVLATTITVIDSQTEYEVKLPGNPAESIKLKFLIAVDAQGHAHVFNPTNGLGTSSTLYCVWGGGQIGLSAVGERRGFASNTDPKLDVSLYYIKQQTGPSYDLYESQFQVWIMQTK